MTNPNQMREVLLFVCSKIMMRPILALNSLLQIVQERSGEGSSVGDALALAFRWPCLNSPIEKGDKYPCPRYFPWMCIHSASEEICICNRHCRQRSNAPHLHFHRHIHVCRVYSKMITKDILGYFTASMLWWTIPSSQKFKYFDT